VEVELLFQEVVQVQHAWAKEQAEVRVQEGAFVAWEVEASAAALEALEALAEEASAVAWGVEAFVAAWEA